MSTINQSAAAKNFYEYWMNKGYEKGESQAFWLALLRQVFGVEEPEKYIRFEEQVKLDHTSFIDAYIAETKVMIEQKSRKKDLRKAIRQSDGSTLTPFQQAKRYITELPVSQHPRWVITCNFQEFDIYDMEKPGGDPVIVKLKDLQRDYYLLQFLVEEREEPLKREEVLSMAAGGIVGKLYDALANQYEDPTCDYSLHSLNILCVRFVFCLYAEDAGVFPHHGQFRDYLAGYSPKHMRNAIIDLFHVLDTKINERSPYLLDELKDFPYVNGGLFAKEDIEIPNFTQEIKDLLIINGSENFDWSEISPTIFGAVFESTLSSKIRREGGMHYTTIENIHKVIDPLFLNKLHSEFNDIQRMDVFRSDGSLNPYAINLKKSRLDSLQDKLAQLTFLDPACGSGNFLTESYLSLRHLENDIIRERMGLQKSTVAGQMTLGLEEVIENDNPIKVTIDQFYGIEINDFAVTVAKTALWIAENQMLKITEGIIYRHIEFLPLKTNAYIVEGNAIRTDWGTAVNHKKLNYIIGNPPFVGSSISSQADDQKKDKELVFKNGKCGKLDYVACWYKKAAEYIKNTDIEVAFVSTNSITQGEQVRPLWEDILNDVNINFAYRTFEWGSESNNKAHVHCVIISFSWIDKTDKFIIDGQEIQKASHINGYLIDAPDFYIHSRSKTPAGLPVLIQGNKPWDGGGLILTPEEKTFFIQKYPELKPYIKKYVGSHDFLNNIERYCFWFTNASPAVYRNIPEIRERLKIVYNKRIKSNTKKARENASTPALFSEIRQPSDNYMVVPETSTATRKYIPMGFLSSDVIASNSLMTMQNATLYMFGVLQSSIHMSWVRVLCGRMKSDYRYSPALYNNFPWPTPTIHQKEKIEKTAQGILDARAMYPNCTLADLYDPLSGQDKLIRAHRLNDKAVMEAYGFTKEDAAFNSESACVAELMKMYQELTSK